MDHNSAFHQTVMVALVRTCLFWTRNCHYIRSFWSCTTARWLIGQLGKGPGRHRPLNNLYRSAHCFRQQVG